MCRILVYYIAHLKVRRPFIWVSVWLRGYRFRHFRSAVTRAQAGRPVRFHHLVNAGRIINVNLKERSLYDALEQLNAATKPRHAREDLTPN